MKGDTFEWKSGNQEEEETPHLDQDQAADLMTRILEVYRKKVGRLPGKVVVHKTSSYGEAERMGLENSLRGVKNHALISLRRSGTLFLRPGRQPVLRGAAIPFGDKLGLVYLSGYIPFLRSYPGTQLPQPFEITENWGSLKFQEAARDLLGLTKLDWSTSAFCTDVPVTLSLPSHVWEMFGMIGHAGTALDDRYYL